MESIFEMARNFRLVLFVIAVVVICAKASAFWPPDLVPHVEIPELPGQPERDDDGCTDS